MNPIGDREMSAPTQKKARTSGGQQAASESEIFLYEGGDVAKDLKTSLTRVRVGPQVTEIPNRAFRGFDKLVDAEFNEGLKGIGEQSFCDCRSLRKVTLPSSVTGLDNRAFLYCSSLIELQLNEGLEVIGEGAFFGCTALRSVTIPSTVTELGGGAFYNCTNLIEVQLKEGLEVIGTNEFAYCEALRSVTIPSTVTELGGGPFEDCCNLSEAIFLNGKRLLNQEFFSRGFQRDDQGLLNQGAVDEMLFVDHYGDRMFAFADCPLTTVKISIGLAVTERMARLPRDCMMSIEKRIRNLSRLEVQQDGNVLACFPVVRRPLGDEAEDSEDEAE